MIRETLKTYIQEKIPEIEGRIGDLDRLKDPTVEGDGVVVALAEEIWKSSWNGYRCVVKVWAYADQAAGGYEQADRLAERLITELDGALITADQKPAAAKDETTSEFACFYLGTSEADFFDLATGRCGRGLRFAVYRHSADSELPKVSDDRLDALSLWTQKLLGTDWTIYLDRWPVNATVPSVLWRLGTQRSSTAASTVREVRYAYVAHIRARSISEERRAIQRLIERLSIQPGIRYDETDRRDLKIAEVTADLQADPLLKGQITLSVTERMRLVEEIVPLIGRVTAKSDMA